MDQLYLIKWLSSAAAGLALSVFVAGPLLAQTAGTAQESATYQPGAAADTVEVEIESAEESPLGNVQYTRGEGARPPAGVARVRQRIAQIRGVQQPAAPAEQAQPIIIVLSQPDARSDQSTSPVSRQTIFVPGPRGHYYPLQGLGDDLMLYRETEPPYRIRILERPEIDVPIGRFDDGVAEADEPIERDEFQEEGEFAEDELPEEVPAEELDDEDDLALDVEEVLDEILQQLPGVEERAPAEVPVIETPGLGRVPTVEEVERAILEAGLFRAVGVNFEHDSSSLLPEAERTLALIGDVLQRYPDIRLEVSGHTDDVGRADYNQRLSEERAEEVVLHLIDRFGIDPDRLEPRGYGADRPYASNDTATGRTLNRRVEFELLNPEDARRTLDDATSDEERLRDALRQIIREELGRIQQDNN